MNVLTNIIHIFFLLIIEIFNYFIFFVLGKQDMILTAILEFVEICLASNNVPQARKLLNDAEASLQQVSKAECNRIKIVKYVDQKDDLTVILNDRCSRPTRRNQYSCFISVQKSRRFKVNVIWKAV